jgi:hypothetical protein
MITVTAINSSGYRAYNYGSRYVHLALPESISGAPTTTEDMPD